MSLDETGKQRGAHEVDGHRITGRGDLRLRTHRLDLVAADEHRPSIVRSAIAIPDSIGHEERWRTNWSGAPTAASALGSGQSRAQRDQTGD